MQSFPTLSILVPMQSAKRKKDQHQRPDIDFDNLLSQGASTYDSAVGHWWHTRSLDLAHRRAYTHIASLASGFCQAWSKQPKVIVDYACGGGSFLGELLRTFPKSHIVGLDGSDNLLKECEKAHSGVCELLDQQHAFKPHSKPVSLAKTNLPNFRLPESKCDLAFLNFPNLVPDPAHLGEFNRNGYCNRADNEVARMLARFREMDPDDETITTPADELFDEYMTARVFSRNLRKLLRKGGILIRVEYTQAPREQLTELTQWRNLFAEGALEEPIKGKYSEAFFRLVGSEYRRSKVILDVFHQTGDPDDKHGGYMVSIFEAI